MAGLESFNMAYLRHRPSRSISEHPLVSPQLLHDSQDAENTSQLHRKTLMEMSRNKGKFKF